jgi:benzoyl-CoA reductase/2-hydroxyglutaryl-CoA dehydratase subunit BcrC/BadD/HgdB
VKITTEKIREAIKKMNKIRKYLMDLSDLRSEMIIQGSEFHAIVKKVQQIDKNQALEILEAKFNEVKTKKPENKNIKKILLTGSDIDDSEFISFLEDIGFHVIADDLGIGSRYFSSLVDESEEPIKALAKFHLNKPKYSTKFPSFSRYENLKALIYKYNIDGVINVANKFCEPVLYSNPYLTKKFKELEIPYLFVEMEYNRESYKQLTTRFEAFAEII